VTFAVDGNAYDRFMGRYSVPLAPRFADFAGIADEQQVLDVGSGPGALTAELIERLGAGAVSAVDPSPSFVAAVRERLPAVTVRQASAEELPFPEDAFDATLAQLVVHFLEDPVRALREMARVTRADGVLAACVWDHAGAHGPLSTFWEVVRETHPAVEDESELPGARKGHLRELFVAAGLRDVEEGVLSVSVEHATFEDWWEPFTLGVGPAGDYVANLDAASREALRSRFEERLSAPFVLEARAWAARARGA
jgi:SAM-dependent methyltransferase